MINLITIKPLNDTHAFLIVNMFNKVFILDGGVLDGYGNGDGNGPGGYGNGYGYEYGFGNGNGGFPDEFYEPFERIKE